MSLGALQLPAVSACAPPRRRPSACLQPAASASTRSSASQAADVHDTPSQPTSGYAYKRSQLKHSIAAPKGHPAALALSLPVGRLAVRQSIASKAARKYSPVVALNATSRYRSVFTHPGCAGPMRYLSATHGPTPRITGGRKADPSVMA